MRAILILICLLNQFTPVECVGNVGKSPHPECGDDKVYTCYVPEKCVANSVTAIPGSKVILLDSAREVFDNCPAIFRYHAYHDDLVRVSIESFESSITSIEFLQYKDVATPIEFSCFKTEGKFIGKYQGEIIENLNGDFISNLKCEFDVSKKPVFALSDSSTKTKALFKIGSDKTNENNFNYDLRCNPKQFKFKEGTNAERKYSAVASNPGEYYCKDNDIFKLEYKMEGSSDYKPVSSLNCVFEDGKFKINDGSKIPKIEKIHIRCVAEAKYFCDYKLKAMESAPNGSLQPVLKKTPPSSKIKQLNCPTTRPHLIVDQMKPFMNAEFECLNYHGSMYWTANGTRLTENGPSVYCTNEVKCHILFKLSESSVENGTLTVDGLPACRNERGTLFIKGGGDRVNSSRCDTSTGELKYQVDGKTEQVIREETRFLCKYTERVNTEQNEQNNKVLASSAAGFFGGAAILGIAIVAGVVFYTNRQFKKRQKRLDETFMQDAIKEEIMWKEHCMDKNEEKEYEDKREAERAKNEDAPASAPCVDPTKLSDPIMSNLVTSLKNVSPDATIHMDTENNPVYSDNNDAVKLRGLSKDTILPSTAATPGGDGYRMQLLGTYIRKVEEWEDE